MLVEYGGTIVTRERIGRTLWLSGAFVDFEHSLKSDIKTPERRRPAKIRWRGLGTSRSWHGVTIAFWCHQVAGVMGKRNG